MKYLAILGMLGLSIGVAWAYSRSEVIPRIAQKDGKLFYRYELREKGGKDILFDTATGDIFVLDRYERAWMLMDLPRVKPEDQDRLLLRF